MPGQNELGVPLLKTCQTCFHAKIRCDKTQDSGICDRCLRLGKTCVFAPARRRVVSRPRLDARQERVSKSPSRKSEKGPAVSSTGSDNSSPATSGVSFLEDGSLDPFQRGILSVEHGQELLDSFRSKMTSYFPFVVIPDSFSVRELQQQKPHLCIAVLAAASFRNVKNQRALGGFFNEVIAQRLAKGPFATLDLLQGLLVHLAWAHFQPRPRRYSQHLLLAVSIVSDLRLDKPRNTEFWDFSDKSHWSEYDWSTDEMRAFAGAYYLSSSTSVLLQKSRHFNYTPYASACCQKIAGFGEYPMDKYLPYIIHLQQLIEEVDDIVARVPEVSSSLQFTESINSVKDKLSLTKSTLPFSLIESPIVLLQLNILETIISQSSPDGTPFGLNKFRDIPKTVPDQHHLLGWLSHSISAIRSLLSVVLVLPHGEEGIISNVGWISCYCALSLAVRLDLLAGHKDLSFMTQHLRQFLDMSHTLRQIVMRLDAATTQDTDARGDRDTFYHLGLRARRLEKWYLERLKELETRNSENEVNTAQGQGTSSSGPVITVSTAGSWETSESIPEFQELSEYPEMWSPSATIEFASEIGLGANFFGGFSTFNGSL